MKTNHIIISSFLLINTILIFSCKKEIEEKQIDTINVKTIKANLDYVSSKLCYVDGDFDNNEGLSVTERGMICGTDSVNIIKNGSKTICSSNTCSNCDENFFRIQITGLQPLTKYYYMAYVIHSNGINFGNIESFTTKSNIPNFTADNFKSIAYTVINNGYLEIRAPHLNNFDLGPWYPDDYRYYIQIELKLQNDSIKTGSYLLYLKSSQGYAYYYRWYDEGGHMCVTGDAMGEQHTGVCDITNVDYQNKTISGTFYFNAFGMSATNLEVNVSNGIFSNVKY